MCLNQKYIFTRSKIISPFHREKLLVPVKCGRCAECMQELKNEWYYRIYNEWLSCVDSGGYIYFDTLTYSNDFLPHLSEFIDVLKDTPVDFPCFCYDDVREFMRLLRRKLDYKGYNIDDNLRYFYCAEYGTDFRYTHRPHYHVLFFVTSKNLDVDTLSSAVDDCWFFGRTDKVRKYGEHANYFTNRNGRSELAVSNYVAKYVQKVSSFQREIDKRIDVALRWLYHTKFDVVTVTKSHENLDTPLYYLGKYVKHLRFRYADSISVEMDDDAYRSYCRSYDGKKCKSDLLRLVNQFHRQSRGFGAQVLGDIDINQIIEDGFLTMPDGMHGVRRIALPKYFERKLFEELINYNGVRLWQKTVDGLNYYRKKHSRVVDYLSDKYKCLFDDYDYHPLVDTKLLAQYVVYRQYTYDGLIGSDIRFQDKVVLPDKWFNYSTSVDRSLLHGAFLSKQFIGCQGQYFESTLEDAISLDVFLRKYMYDSEKSSQYKGFEKILDKLRQLQLAKNRAKQRAFDYLQERKNSEKHRRQLVLAL